MNDKKLTYNELVLPQHREALEKGRHRRIQMPIFFSSGDLMELFKTTAKDILSAADAEKTVQPATAEQIASIDARLRKPLFEDPATYSRAACLTSNALLHAFAFLGAASCEERGIICDARKVDINGTMLEDGRINVLADPEFFRDHKDKALVGAKAFFLGFWQRLERPNRTTLIASISPAAGLN